MTDQATPPAAFDEFKLFYESAEKVTDRRTSTNSTNYTICSATLMAIAILLDWSLKRPAFLAVGLASAILLSSMAVLFCSLWVGQIKDYKELNNAKFAVLNEMAAKVRFSETLSDPRRSYEPFALEWHRLEKAKAIREVGDSRLLVLKSSNLEYLVPRMFRILFLLLILASVFATVRNWRTVSSPTSLTVLADSAISQHGRSPQP